MQLIWFRHDLRVHDHMALWFARQQGHCLALCVLSPEQWQQHQDAKAKIDLYLRRLNVLKQQLAAFNIPLIMMQQDHWRDLPATLLEVCQHFGITRVHAHVDVGLNEQQRDNAVSQYLAAHDIESEYYDDRTLFPLGSIRNGSDAPYQVFSAFKKKCYERLILDVPAPLPEITAQPALELDVLRYEFDLAAFAHTYSTAEIAAHWPADDAHIQQRLDQFIEDQLEFYKAERDFPNLDGTSQLSPYLNIGALSIRQCMHALFSASNGYFQLDNEGQHTWLDELLWREFYQHTLSDFPRLSQHQPFKTQTKHIQWRDAPKDLAAWQQGLTGIPIVDAGMRQLLATGWMHNRVRMITAMFLSKNLLIDWRLGEAWFMQHLIDGDLAANNGGWQWCASTGMDAAPYFRIFNPISQSQKFDANGDYIRRWVPELAHIDAKHIHAPYEKELNVELNYPRPIVDLKSSRVRAIDAFKVAHST